MASGILWRGIAHPAVMVAGEGREEPLLRRGLATADRPAEDVRAKVAPPRYVGGLRVVGESDVLRSTPHGHPLHALRRWRHTRPQWYQQATLPRWITPLTIGYVALSIMYNLDHFSTFSHPFPTLLITGALAVFLLMHYLALVHAGQRPVPVRKQLATLALIGLLALNTVVHVVEVLPHLAQTHRYNTDAAAATDCAARLFLQGHDPYLNIRMLTCLHSNGLGPSQTTPRQAGTFWIFRTYPSPMTAHFQYLRYRVYWRELRREQRNPAYRTPEFETRFNYPGAAILIAALALLLGSRDLVPLYVGCALVASILIYRRTDPRTRWATGLLLLGDTPLLLDEVGGTTDSLYALLLILAWQIRARPLVAGLLLGLAAASRQQAWFFVPFLLYLGWRHSGWSDLVRRGAATLAVFLVGNLPFIIASPEDWLTGVLGPGRDPTFAQGVGLVALSIARILPLGPPAVYGALEWIVLVAGFLYFTRRCMTSPGLAMFLPLLPLVVAWRSLHTYFLLIPLLATAVLAGPPDPSAESQVESMPLLHLRSIASPSASRRWTIRG